MNTIPSAPDADAAAPADGKGNADTGVEGVAGIAVLAASASVISRKRK